MSFKRLDPEDFLVSADSIISPAWSDYETFLVYPNLYKSLTQQNSDSGQYYLNVYSTDPTVNPNAEIQFATTYGDASGLGQALYNSSVSGSSPTRTVYGQFVNLLLGEDENASFNFGGPSANNEYFWAIVVDRARYKQSIVPGNFQIQLRGTDWLDIFITDNSRITPTVDYTPAGRRYTLGSGSFGDGVMPAGSTEGVYGYLYPDVGIIVLNCAAVATTDPAFQPIFRSFDANENAPDKLRERIYGIFLQSQETVASDFVFCRARNAEFNYSVNPSFSVSASAGSILYNDFIQNPVTYITSVGMYNDNNELLAVAKLSKPLKKDFTKEALIRVKLDF
jgi:hypothetical protein